MLIVTNVERSNSAIVTFLDEIKSLHKVYVHKNLKLHTPGLEISEVTKLCTYQLTNISLNSWMSSEALRIAILLKTQPI